MRITTDELFELARVIGLTVKPEAILTEAEADMLAARVFELQDQFSAAQQLSATLLTRLEWAEGDIATRTKALKQLDQMLKDRDETIAELRQELAKPATLSAADCVILKQGERKDGGQ